jgi:hypothetical protein
MHARHASPLLGRFLSFDPIGGSLRAPQSWNRYAYVLGNPLKLIDPYGLRSQPIAKFEGSITVTASAGGILMSDLTTADRLYIYGIGYASLLGLATRDDGLSPFAVGIGREVWASTGFISVYGDKAAQAADYATGYVSAMDALILEKNPTEAGLAVAVALIPGPLDNGALVASRAFTADQQALVALAKAVERGVSKEEAAILVEWAHEYGMKGLSHLTPAPRHFFGIPHIHVGPVNHIPVR